MQLLTTTGYKNIEDCFIGEQLVAYDINSGAPIVNELLGKQWFSFDMFEDKAEVLDEEGNVITEGKTKEQIFEDTYGPLTFYTINDTYKVFANQSIWANLKVVHGSKIQVGDVIYDDRDNDIIVTSVEESTADGWWRMTVSGDHSYIADDLTLHNASRYWSGNMTATSSNWSYNTGGTNWGSASGTADNASIPASTDDVTFDGAGTNGNTASTISATITILSLNITTGYTSTMTHNAVLTIAGNWTYTGNYTIAGSSGITISAASTINSNGATWPNVLTFSGAATYTLSNNLIVNKVINFTANCTINKTTSETLTLAGGFSISSNITVQGTAKFIWTGGTWATTGYTNLINNIEINGNVSFGSRPSCFNNTVTYISGTVTTTGSEFVVQGTMTLNTNGITFNKFTLGAPTPIITLTSNLSVSGLFSNTAGYPCTANATVSETITIGGGMTFNSSMQGTAKIILTGGTWSAGTVNIFNNVDLQGNITVSNSVYCYNNTVTYVSGTITTTGSTFYINGTSTLNTTGMAWNNVILGSPAATVTLTSNLLINGTLTAFNSSAHTINKTTSETVTVAGGLTVNNSLTGTAPIYLTGGTWSGSNTISSNLFLNGNITATGTLNFGSGTLTYQTGTITTTGSTLNINGNATLDTSIVRWNNLTFGANNSTNIVTDLISAGTTTISASTTLTKNRLARFSVVGPVNITATSTLLGFDKIPLPSVLITAGAIITMNRFFTGTPSQICQVSSTGANYTITFQDNFEKIGRYVSVSGCTLTRPMQLLLTTNPRLNTNRSTNVGIRYSNQSPNGISRNMAPTSDMTSPSMGLVSDPCFVKQG